MARIGIINSIESLFRRHTRKRAVEHINAHTIEEAVAILGDSSIESRIIAGGVDLIGLMRNGLVDPQVIVNIKTIPGLDRIKKGEVGLTIGALATIHEIEESELIREEYPILAEASRSVGAPHIRNMATVGGNLCQETRCWYYRRSPKTGRTFFCTRKGGEHCYAVTGENAYHCIFSETECHSASPSDLAPALIALGARVNIAGILGNRTVSLEDFYLPDGKNILQPDEIITEIQIPAIESSARQRFVKFRTRKAIDFALASVAVVITTEGDRVTAARIVLGGVSPTPYRAVLAEDVLKNQVLSEEIAEKAAASSVIESSPLSKNAYKIPLTRNLVRKALYG